MYPEYGQHYHLPADTETEDFASKGIGKALALHSAKKGAIFLYFFKYIYFLESLSGKNVLITGASKDIRKIFAFGYAKTDDIFFIIYFLDLIYGKNVLVTGASKGIGRSLLSAMPKRTLFFLFFIIYFLDLIYGKNVLVTGASKGIGKALALEYARLGANVMVTARTEKALKEVNMK